MSIYVDEVYVSRVVVCCVVMAYVCCVYAFVLYFFFFFKQKTAYEIVDCDWSSDVCSSDLMMVASRRIRCKSTSATPMSMVSHSSRAGISMANEIGRASCRERV